MNTKKIMNSSDLLLLKKLLKIQNHRQKVFNRGVLHLCRGAWHCKNWQNSTDL